MPFCGLRRARMHILLGLARAGKCNMTSINDKWYVGQVLAGKEASTLSQCRKLIDPSILHESFVPEFETMWKSSAGCCSRATCFS